MKKQTLDNLLKKLIIDKAKIFIKNDELLKLTRDDKIEFTCSCGESGEKCIRMIIEKGGFYCKTCTTKNGREKRKQTNMKNFGVPYTFQAEKVKNKIKQTNMKNLRVPYPMQAEEVREKGKQTNMKNFGVPNPMQAEEVREKGKQTNMKNFGVPNPFQAEKVKNKIKQTNMKNLRVPYPMQAEEVREKGKQTNMKNFGVPYTFQAEKVKNKIKQTNMKNFGVPNPMQNRDVQRKAMKSSLKKKEFIFKDGRKVDCRGYEPQMLEKLENEENKTRDDIVVDSDKNMPQISYNYNGKREYTPDIYIEKENRLIEVKSKYFFEIEYEKNMCKLKSTCENGFNIELYVLSKKGEIIKWLGFYTNKQKIPNMS